jgi:hypothetical protein
MKRSIQLLVIVIVLLTTSACSFLKPKPVTNLTIPPETEYLVLGVEFVGAKTEDSNPTVFKYKEIRTNVYYYADNGQFLGKELIQYNASNLNAYYYKDFAYIFFEDNNIHEINLTTGQIRKLDLLNNKNSYANSVNRSGNVLLVHYKDNKKSSEVINDEICTFSVEDIKKEKCVSLEEGEYEVFEANDFFYVWNKKTGILVQHDINLNEVKSTDFGEFCFLEHDQGNIYIMYRDGIYDLQNEMKYDLNLVVGFYDYYIFDGELFLEDGQTVTGFDIKSGDKLSENMIENKGEFGNIFDEQKGLKHISVFERTQEVLVPLDMKTLKLSELRFVIEFDEKDTFFFVYGLHTYPIGN